MSHLVTIQTQVRDPVAVGAACRRLGLAEPLVGTAQLYSGSAAGLLVHLPDWRYPVVLDTATGVVHFDNYGGAWGPQSHLDRFLQSYAAEKTKLEARKHGHVVTEQELPDGSLRLQVLVGA